jgi:hypothetical protein
MKVSLVCIAKNEDKYIDEWIDYHLKIGFHHIFIYQNNWSYVINNSNVTTIPFDGDAQQLNSYNDFITKYHTKYDWGGFFDVDEFLVLKRHNNVVDFIKDYESYDNIAINWVFFGDNNLDFNGDYSVVKRFTKRESKPDKHIKIISKIKPEIKFINPHFTNVKWVDCKYKMGHGPFNLQGDIETVQLNHYFCKTRIEFQNKLNRGRADIKGGRYDSLIFDVNNYNEVTDYSAHNFLYQKRET